MALHIVDKRALPFLLISNTEKWRVEQFVV